MPRSSLGPKSFLDIFNKLLWHAGRRTRGFRSVHVQITKLIIASIRYRLGLFARGSNSFQVRLPNRSGQLVSHPSASMH
jgi:hypothetical protein